MLNRVTINDYRSLHAIDVPLKPLTVIIGPNNTGKSSFLSAIELFDTASAQINAGSEQIVRTDLWNLNAASTPVIKGFLDNGGDTTVRRNHQQKAYWFKEGEWKQLNPISFFNSSVLLPKMLCTGTSDDQGIPMLDDKAGNVPAFIDAVLRKDRDRFDLILSTLKRLIPGLADISIGVPKNDMRRIDLKWENNLLMEAENASYGVRLMIFFVALANHPNPPKIVLLEEPETGVHLERLEEIMKLLKSLTERELSAIPTQVILTTHSPYLLDCVDPEKHQVLVFQRQPNGECNAQPVDNERLKLFMKEFMLGEVWMNQHESGLVKKAE